MLSLSHLSFAGTRQAVIKQLHKILTFYDAIEHIAQKSEKIQKKSVKVDTQHDKGAMQMKSRKACCPEDTVKRIKEILSKMGIEVEEIDINNHAGFWCSLRLCLKGIPELGTNGKGINLAFARASAYAEFMERLQSGYLIRENLFNCESLKRNKNENIVDFCEGMRRIKKALPKEEIVRKHKQITETELYYHVNSGDYVSMPQWYIDNDCGSNGLCAGNIPEEAILQGLNEVFEREARKRLFLGKLTPFNVPREDLVHLHAYYMISEIERLGYTCLIKDLTDHGELPVLGVVIINQTRDFNLVSIGSDYDLDICLQRCITELFQGRYISPFLSNQMNRTFKEGNLFYYVDNLENAPTYQSNVIDNTGNYPISMYDTTDYSADYKMAFQMESKSIKQCLIQAFDSLNKQNIDIYIQNLSSAGFPTYRIYVPGYSELCNMANLKAERLDNLECIRQLYFRISELTLEETIKFENAIKSISDIPFHDYSNILSRVLPLELNIDPLGVRMDDSHLLLCLMYIKHGKLDNAKLHWDQFAANLGSSIDEDSKLQQMAVTIVGMLASVDLATINKALRLFESENIGCNLFNIQSLLECLPKCPNCVQCKQNQSCRYRECKDVKQYIEKL